MERWIAMLTLAACVGCQSQRSTLEHLVPNDAFGIISVDLQAFMKADPAYRKVLGEFMDDDPIKGMASVFERRCDVDHQALGTVVVGVRADPDVPVFAIQGPRLGKGDTLACLVDAGVQGLGWPAELLEYTEDEGLPTVRVADGQLKAWGVDERTLVITGQDWADAVRARIRGKGSAAVEGALRAAVAAVHTEAPIWMAFDFASVPQLVAEHYHLRGARRASATVRLYRDLDFEGHVEFANSTAAEASRRALQQSLDEMADEIPLPPLVFDSIVLGVDGSTLTVEAKLPASALR